MAQVMRRIEMKCMTQVILIIYKVVTPKVTVNTYQKWMTNQVVMIYLSQED